MVTSIFIIVKVLPEEIGEKEDPEDSEYYNKLYDYDDPDFFPP